MCEYHNDLVCIHVTSGVEWERDCGCDDCQLRGAMEHKMVTIMEDGMEELVCDWCDMTYHLGGWDYYQIEVCKKVRTICSDCYVRLRYLSVESQVKKRNGDVVG